MDSELGKDIADFALKTRRGMAGEIRVPTGYVLVSLAAVRIQWGWMQAVFNRLHSGT